MFSLPKLKNVVAVSSVSFFIFIGNNVFVYFYGGHTYEGGSLLHSPLIRMNVKCYLNLRGGCRSLNNIILP